MDAELLVVAVGAVVVLGGLLFALMKSRGRASVGHGPGAKTLKTQGTDRLVKNGRYGEAAGLAFKEQNWDEAIDLYRKADQPANAANAARRAGKDRQAAELYEMAGDMVQAAACWEAAGDHQRADRLRGGSDESEEDRQPSEAPRRAFTDEDESLEVDLVPSLKPAADAETAFRQKMSGASEAPEEDPEVQELAAEAADKLLAAGEIRRAAEVFRDAGLLDEAVHLFVNVLGAPGEAAPLLAARGNHERAAELYEMAGLLERAAAAWVEIARESDRPDSYVDRIEALSEDVAFNFLSMETSVRPLTEDTAELHYRFGLSCEKRGDQARAQKVFNVLIQTVGEYKDAGDRIVATPAGPVDTSGPTLASPGSPAPEPPMASPIEPASPRAETLASPRDPRAPRRGPVDASAETRTSPRGPRAPRRGPVSPSAETMASPAERRAAAQQRFVEPARPAGGGGYSIISDDESAPPRRRQSDQLESALSNQELQRLVMQASQGAARRLERVEIEDQLSAAVIYPDRRTRRQKWWGGELPTLLAVGVEERPFQSELLADAQVQATQTGPSIETLREYIGDGPCDLGNIEVFYRLGLAYLGKGRWSDAQRAFEQVEDVSPGYRDAEKRVAEIDAWQLALGRRRTGLGDAGSVPPSADATGRYQLDGELGRGGMAVVYRAHDRVLGRDVALKFMAEEVSERDDLCEMFEREARAAASLNHPGIVTIYDFGLIEGRAFICMELVDGLPIDELQEQLTIVESVQIARQTLEALDYAHGKKIIHRDIKPANMMRTQAGLVKLMDFGLARPTDSRRKRSLIAGTPAFMPPEQLAGGELDHRADIFAMGVTLYELLTQELPYEGVDRREPPMALRDLVPAIPKLVDDAVLRAIEPNAEDRWESAGQFADVLGDVVAAVGRFSSLPPADD